MTVRNWNRDVEFHAPGPTHGTPDAARALGYRIEPPASAAADHSLAITAVYEVGPQHTEIVSIAPDAGAPSALQPGDTYSLVGLDAAGHVISHAGALATIEHADQSSPEVLILGKLAAAGVDEVEVLQDGQPIAREQSSAYAPTVSVTGLRTGLRVGGPHGVVIHWRSHDVDGGQLGATVRYSRDDGRTWSTVYMGADRGEAVLPSGFLSASRSARLRIYISDGFNEAIVTSSRFVAVGAPPVVTITSPQRAARVSAGSALDLTGRALDDAGRQLSGHALTWRAEGRVIARGAHALTVSLPAGHHEITLTVRDHTGRTATASVRVTITPAPPVVTSLGVPNRVSRGARSFTLRIASLAPATLTIGRARTIIGRKARTVRVPITPGRKAITLVLALRSGRFATAVPVRVTR